MEGRGGKDFANLTMSCNNIATLEPWISNQFCVLAGRDGQGSTSGLGNSHDVVGQSPGSRRLMKTMMKVNIIGMMEKIRIRFTYIYIYIYILVKLL